MPTVCLVCEYDGAAFHGWQLQPNVRTVQEVLHQVLQTVLRQPLSPLSASGRTDSGVHALRQVVSFSVAEAPDLHRLCHSVSNLLKGELAVVAGYFVSDDFHPTRAAIAKEYQYRIINRPQPLVLERGKAWQVAVPLDVAAMQQAAAVLRGTHDFASFQCAGCSAATSVRHIFESEITVHGNEYCYRVVGSGFLKQMVRSIVGTLVAIGKQHSAPMEEILAACDRRRAGPTAPPYGLTLQWVEYPGHFFGRVDTFRP